MWGSIWKLSKKPISFKCFYVLSKNIGKNISTYNLAQNLDHTTIYALSTASGKAGIAVIRISGPACVSIYQKLAYKYNVVPKSRTTLLTTLYDPRLDANENSNIQLNINKNLPSPNSILDKGIVLYFKCPHSYTGEDMLELQVHGGIAVVKSILDSLAFLDGKLLVEEKNTALRIQKKINSNINMQYYPIRYAEQGEFTRRAFMNNRLDLTEVEGIRDVIDAETESQRRAAINSANGEIKELYKKWRFEILNNLALLTAIIDFSDDAETISIDKIWNQVTKSVKLLVKQINNHLKQIERWELTKSGIRVALLGPPNAGKSTLLNTLARRDVAIVSNIPGTTRDILEVAINLNGEKFIIEDTAGLRNKSYIDQVEVEGIKRALKAAGNCNLILLLFPTDFQSIDDEFFSLIKDFTNKIICVFTKSDISKNLEKEKQRLSLLIKKNVKIKDSNIISISCLTGDGIIDLQDTISRNAFKFTDFSSQMEPAAVSFRVAEILKKEVLVSLNDFLQFDSSDDIAISSEALNSAANAFGKIMGQNYDVEEILGVIFSSFCVGK